MEDTAMEDTAMEDTAMEDTAMESSAETLKLHSQIAPLEYGPHHEEVVGEWEIRESLDPQTQHLGACTAMYPDAAFGIKLGSVYAQYDRADRFVYCKTKSRHSPIRAMACAITIKHLGSDKEVTIGGPDSKICQISFETAS